MSVAVVGTRTRHVCGWGFVMSSARVPGSLRRPAAKPANVTKVKRDATTTGIFTAACLAAASPATIALAQSTPSGPLPPLSVEAKQPKKQATPAPAKKAGTAAPVAAPAPAHALTPAQKSANPYANPDAPYKVEQSASRKLTEPLVNTPRDHHRGAEGGARRTQRRPRCVNSHARDSRRDVGLRRRRQRVRRLRIRGFKASNDIFVDNIRDPGNVIARTLRGRADRDLQGSERRIAGRGTIGGALNIITKQPDDDRNFYELSTMVGTDSTSGASRSTSTRW